MTSGAEDWDLPAVLYVPVKLYTSDPWKAEEWNHNLGVWYTKMQQKKKSKKKWLQWWQRRSSSNSRSGGSRKGRRGGGTRIRRGSSSSSSRSEAGVDGGRWGGGGAAVEKKKRKKQRWIRRRWENAGWKSRGLYFRNHDPWRRGWRILVYINHHQHQMSCWLVKEMFFHSGAVYQLCNEIIRAMIQKYLVLFLSVILISRIQLILPISRTHHNCCFFFTWPRKSDCFSLTCLTRISFVSYFVSYLELIYCGHPGYFNNLLL